MTAHVPPSDDTIASVAVARLAEEQRELAEEQRALEKLHDAAGAARDIYEHRRMPVCVMFGGGRWFRYVRAEAPCWKGEIHVLGVVVLFERRAVGRARGGGVR